MPSNHDQPWGLIVPGRPGTPSEGAAQYTRLGPRESQRIKTFDNGTCLEFGPDDPVDEFLAGHPFANQIAQIDTVIRDIRAARQRYEGPHTRQAFHEGGSDVTAVEEDPFINFRTDDQNRHILGHIQLESGMYAQVPSRFAFCGNVVSTYSIFNKSDWPGDTHPGNVDSRFGQGGKMIYPTLPRNDQSGIARGRAKQANRLHTIIANYRQRTPTTSRPQSPDESSQAGTLRPPAGNLVSRAAKPARNVNNSSGSATSNNLTNNHPGQSRRTGNLSTSSSHNFAHSKRSSNNNFAGPTCNTFAKNSNEQFGAAVNFPFAGNFGMQSGNYGMHASNFGQPGNFIGEPTISGIQPFDYMRQAASFGMQPSNFMGHPVAFGMQPIDFMGPAVNFGTISANLTGQADGFGAQSINFMGPAVDWGGPVGDLIAGSDTNFGIQSTHVRQESSSGEQSFVRETASSTTSPTNQPSNMHPSSGLRRTNPRGQSDDYDTIYDSNGTISNSASPTGILSSMNFRAPQPNRVLGNSNLAASSSLADGFSKSNGPVMGSPPLTHTPERQVVTPLSFENLPGGGLSTASPVMQYIQCLDNGALGQESSLINPTENLLQISSLRQPSGQRLFQELRPNGIHNPNDCPSYAEYKQYHEQHRCSDWTISQAENSQLFSEEGVQLGGQEESSFTRYLDELNAMSNEMGHKSLEGDHQSGHSQLQSLFNIPISVEPPSPRIEQIFHEDRNDGVFQQHSFLDRLPASSQNVQQRVRLSSKASSTSQGRSSQFGTRGTASAGEHRAVPRKPPGLGSLIPFNDGDMVGSTATSNTIQQGFSERRVIGSTIKPLGINQSSANSRRNHLHPAIPDINLARSFSQLATLTPLQSVERPTSNPGQIGQIRQFSYSPLSVSMPVTRTGSPIQHPGNPKTPDEQVGLLGYNSNTGEVNMGEFAIPHPTPGNFGVPGRRRLFER